MREECVIRKLTAVLILLLCLPLSSCGQKTALTGSVLGQAAGLEENETLLVIDWPPPAVSWKTAAKPLARRWTGSRLCRAAARWRIWLRRTLWQTLRSTPP